MEELGGHQTLLQQATVSSVYLGTAVKVKSLGRRLEGHKVTSRSSRLRLILNQIRLSEKAVWRKTNHKNNGAQTVPGLFLLQGSSIRGPACHLTDVLPFVSSRPSIFILSQTSPPLSFSLPLCFPLCFTLTPSSLTSFLSFHLPLCLNLFLAKSCRDGGLSWRLGAARQAIKKPRRREAGP